MRDPRYPTGTLGDYIRRPDRNREEDIQRIAEFPAALTAISNKLQEHQWDIPYREGGWTARQVVHHLADSHMNAFIRMKLVLTEERPVIKPYQENNWAMWPDARTADPALSIGILQGLHPRMVQVLHSAEERDWERACFHPEQERELSLEFLAGMYAWHGRHHLGHLELVLEK